VFPNIPLSWSPSVKIYCLLPLSGGHINYPKLLLLQDSGNISSFRKIKLWPVS
jgi:hypothetical protein